ncbi:MAG: hypothetical protein IIU15_00795, partial [Treponema sp.]|nr:hypothetical protein [Treponema sp.]
DFMMLCLNVIKDWRVLTALGVFLVFALLATYVVKYKKKPPKPKTVRAPKPKPQPKKEKSEDEGEEEE